jgi:hypothetical protein
MFATTIHEQAIENADLAEQDHKSLLQAIADGRLETSMVY